MYIDFIKNDYSNKSKNEAVEYIERDKVHLGKIIQERITNDIKDIADRWYQLDDIGYIPENEKFLYLLKEAENLFCFGYFTGTIAVVGIACEEFCKYLINKNKIKETEDQNSRINELLKKSVINNTISSALHNVRKIRNNCIHYNTSFKELDVNQLKEQALTMIKLYKTCLSILTVSIEIDSEKLIEKLLQSQKLSFTDFKYRNRNIDLKQEKIDLQISPQVSNLIFTSNYYVDEIDIETERFKEMTLLDLYRGCLPVVVDLTLPQTDLIQKMKVEQGNIIFASMISSITTIGQTEEWHLLTIYNIFREKISLGDIEKYMG